MTQVDRQLEGVHACGVGHVGCQSELGIPSPA